MSRPARGRAAPRRPRTQSPPTETPAPAARAARAPRERGSRTPYVLLGMLLQGPATGYGLRERIKRSVGSFWHESYGQLYPALEALAADGLVRAARTASDGRDTRPWEITAEGRAALTAWLDHPPRPQPERNELLLKVFFAELAPEVVRQHVEHARGEAARDLARLEALRRGLVTERAGLAGLPHWLATVDYGIAGQRALVAWCDQTLEALAAKPAGRSRRA